MCLVGIEGTGSYSAGLARHMSAAGVRVVEVDRSDQQDRRRQGKSDPLDAVSAARAAQSGRAPAPPKGRDGAVEAVRALMADKRSARSERTQAINQARALIVTGPEDLRARFTAHGTANLVAELAALRPRPGAVVGSDTAAILLIAAGDHPERLRSEAAWAHLCAVAPIPASSGKTKRHRLQPGRRPAGQPRPVADRDHPDELPPRDPGLRRPAYRPGPVQERDHALPQTLRRPRGLPPPARTWLADAPTPGAAWPSIRLPQPCWPSIDCRPPRSHFEPLPA